MVPGRDAQKKNELRNRILLVLGVSLFLHALLMVGLYHTQLGSDVKIPENTVFIDLDPKNLPSEEELAAMTKDKARQVVESEAANQVPSKDAKYLGERDNSVEQETKSAKVDSFRKGGKPGDTGTAGSPKLALKNLAPPNRQITPPTQAEIDGFKEVQKQRQAQQQASNGGARGSDSPGSASNDYLKDVKEGDRTLLNTKEFVYFSYYRRIRERLEVAWNSKLRAALGGQVYGGERRLANDKNYVTGLTVVLDRNGKITAIKVRQRSGQRDLDTAAVDAFNDAGPFPDPPSGLVDSEGQIQIPWDFILQS